MKNKNKNYFGEKKLVFFAEVQEVSESELSNVKKMKEEGGEELDVAGLVKSTNDLIGKHKDQFDGLPKEFTDLLHNEIVNYFQQSPGRFEKDEKKGLSAAEFKNYRDAMVAKADEIIKEYAPTEEEKAALNQAKAKAKEASEKAETIKPVEAEDISEDPGSIEDVEVLEKKYTEYDGWNASLQKEGSDALTASGGFQKSLADYKKSINGINSYRKFGKWVKGAWGSITSVFSSGPAPVDPEIQKLRDAQSAAKGKIDKISEKYKQSKDKLKKYGEKLGGVSNTLKDKLTKKRDEDLKEIRARRDETEEQKKEREAKKAKLEEQQKAMIGKRDEMAKYQDEVSKSKDTEEKRIDTAKMKQDQLGRYDQMLKDAAQQIDEALKNPDITEEQKQKLEEAKKTLTEKSTEIGDGLKASNMVIESGGEAAAVMEGEEKENARKSLQLGSHLETQVKPGIKSLDDSIAALEEAKMQYASKEEQAVDIYGKAFEVYDTMDASIDNAVLKNNLANEQITKSLENSKKFLDNTTVEGPGFWESTIGVPFSMAGGALSAVGEFCFEQAKALADGADSLKGSGWYWPAKIGSEVVNFTIGVAGGLFEMGGGLLNMVGTPGDTLNGMGALIGRDPLTGEWTGKTAGEAWLNLGKALIAYDDWKAGRPGLALGRIFPNVVLALEGGGAATAGKEAAQAAFTAAREAGSGVLTATGKATVAFGKGVAIDLAETGKGIGKFVAGGEGEANLAMRAAKGVKSFVVGAEGEASGLNKLGQAAKAAPGKMVEAAKAAPTKFMEGTKALAAQVERLWGGTKFEGVRLAKKQLGIVDELGSKAGKYDEFQSALDKLRKENPGMNESQLRLKLSQDNIKLFTEGFQFEQKLDEWGKTQAALEKSVLEGMKTPGMAEKARAEFLAQRTAAEGIVNTGKEFDDFRKLIKDKDPKAIEASKKFQAALESGDPKAIQAAKLENPQWIKAFENMENQAKLAETQFNLAALKKSDEIQVKFKAVSPEEGEKYLGELQKKATTPEEAALLDRALMLGIQNGGVADSIVYTAIEKGTMKAGPGVVDALIDQNALRVVHNKNIEINPKHQAKIAEKMTTPGSRDYDVDALKQLVEDGRIDVSNPEVINSLGRTSMGADIARELILEGKAPLTRETIEGLMHQESDLATLEGLLGDNKIKLEAGVSKEKLLEDIKMRKEALADEKVVKSYRDPAHPEKINELKKLLDETAKKIKNGETVSGEVADLLKRLKERDPEAYKMVLNSDANRLVSTECLDSIISGRKTEFIDSNGQKVTAYNGKFISQGGMGTVDHVVYMLPGGEKFEFAVIKKSHAHTKEFFKEEVNACKEVQGWNHPNIIKPLHITDDFIIYETGEKASDMWNGLHTLDGDQYFTGLSEIADGIMEYQKRGKFHGDLKEANTLRVKVGTDANGADIYQVKVIDNTPVDATRSSGARDYPATPMYCFDNTEYSFAVQNLRSRGMQSADINQWMARAIDARAYGKMMSNALDRFLPDWHTNPQLKYLVDRLNSPWTAGDPGLIQEAQNTVKALAKDFERTTIPAPPPAIPVAVIPPPSLSSTGRLPMLPGPPTLIKLPSGPDTLPKTVVFPLVDPKTIPKPQLTIPLSQAKTFVPPSKAKTLPKKPPTDTIPNSP